MRLMKRKKGDNEYYYLQHSFRKNSRVITREKYLGKAIPPNIDEIKRQFNEGCYKESLHKLFEAIGKNFQKEWKKYPESIKEKIKEQIAVAFTYNTNAIEGSTITLDETRELLENKIAPHKPMRDIKETEHHAKIFLEMIKQKETPSIPLILKWHEQNFQETKPDIAGKFRDYLVRVCEHVAPDWQDVKRLMKELIAFYDKNDKMNAVELAARMHYKFEKIHPFGDGNGRIGRLMMNQILWQNGYPLLIIEYTKRTAYYHALRKDENYFFNYFTRRYLKVHKKYIQ